MVLWARKKDIAFGGVPTKFLYKIIRKQNILKRKKSEKENKIKIK